jgi:hypothetical protein
MQLTNKTRYLTHTVRMAGSELRHDPTTYRQLCQRQD